MEAKSIVKQPSRAAERADLRAHVHGMWAAVAAVVGRARGHTSTSAERA